MNITFLGTGSIIPDPVQQRSYSAILVEINNDKLLFDIGPGTLTKMQTLGINTQISPKYLFISHYHIDHCLDYIALVKSRHFNEKTGKISKGKKKLQVFGPPGLKRWNHDIFQKVLKWNYMSKELNYKDVTSCREIKSGLVIKKKNWQVTCCPIDHDNGIAFRVNAKGKSFIYSGDMAYDERISILGKDADLVAIECSFPNKKSLSGKHLEPNLIAKLAKLGNFKTIVLTHMYPVIFGREKQITDIIEKNSDSRVIIAHDFKKIHL